MGSVLEFVKSLLRDDLPRPSRVVDARLLGMGVRYVIYPSIPTFITSDC